MKNIVKIFVLLFVTGFMSSCEPDEYAKPDIDLTPVYTISDTGNNDMKTINIYREKSLLTVWNKDGAVTSYQTKDFSDVSDDTNYIVTVTALENVSVTDENNVVTMVTITHAYSLTADKTTGVATVDILTTKVDATTSNTPISGMIIEEEVYN